MEKILLRLWCTILFLPLLLHGSLDPHRVGPWLCQVLHSLHGINNLFPKAPTAFDIQPAYAQEQEIILIWVPLYDPNSFWKEEIFQCLMLFSSLNSCSPTITIGKGIAINDTYLKYF